jgi:hypothetical protein
MSDSTADRYPMLVSVVVIALMAVLAGASGPTGIGKRAALNEEFLLHTLDLPNGIPRLDGGVVGRVTAPLFPHGWAYSGLIVPFRDV